jgi:uncharacterized protein YjbI with pentapeptide repeats
VSKLTEEQVREIADLSGADLRGAQYSDHTTWSVVLDPGAAGAVLEEGA